MDRYAASLIGRYRRSGVLVDTNLLLLTFVGAYDRSLVARFKRTADRFAPEDFDTLAGLLRQFTTVVTTPHILTEVSNLLGNLSGQARTACFELFAGDVRLMRERRTPGAALSNNPAFVAFGIADTGCRLRRVPRADRRSDPLLLPARPGRGRPQLQQHKDTRVLTARHR